MAQAKVGLVPASERMLNLSVTGWPSRNAELIANAFVGTFLNDLVAEVAPAVSLCAVQCSLWSSLHLGSLPFAGAGHGFLSTGIHILLALTAVCDGKSPLGQVAPAVRE